MVGLGGGGEPPDFGSVSEKKRKTRRGLKKTVYPRFPFSNAASHAEVPVLPVEMVPPAVSRSCSRSPGLIAVPQDSIVPDVALPDAALLKTRSSPMLPPYDLKKKLDRSSPMLPSYDRSSPMLPPYDVKTRSSPLLLLLVFLFFLAFLCWPPLPDLFGELCELLGTTLIVVLFVVLCFPPRPQGSDETSEGCSYKWLSKEKTAKTWKRGSLGKARRRRESDNKSAGDEASCNRGGTGRRGTADGASCNAE